ncbi:MAG: hypothetical protein IJZ12_04065 [Clostridia bacterium]|nr:hypothetical protein [Clostridia bacterium]
MMKKYNKPEIVTLALDMVDVIETSGERIAAGALVEQNVAEGNITVIEKQVTAMADEWSW